MAFNFTGTNGSAPVGLTELSGVTLSSTTTANSTFTFPATAQTYICMKTNRILGDK